MQMLQRMFPVNGLDQVRHEMDRLFESLTRPANGGTWFRPESLLPAINLWEDGERIFVEAEVPGLKLEDLTVEVVGQELIIKGQRNLGERENQVFHRQERVMGEFARLIPLPMDVNSEKVEAVLKDGVLTITLPKAETARARKITVKVS